jgi:selenide,water dikinase
MKQSNAPVTRDLVLIGGGHSHVEVLRSFGMKPVPGVRLTLIARDVHTPYSGMLPGLVAGHYGYDDTHVDLRPLCRFAGARLLHDSAVGLNLRGRAVLCRDHPPVAYDLLSLDIGSTPDVSVPGAAEHVVPVKPINRFLDHWEELHRRVLDSNGPLRIAVVGTGAGGVELLMAMRHRLRGELAQRGDDPERLVFVLIGDAETPLPTHNRRVRAAFARILAERDVELHNRTRIAEVRPDRLLTLDGREIPVDETLWVTAAGAAGWLRETGLALDERGFIAVAPTLQSTSHPAVFACGDIAGVAAHPRPKAGVFAVRQGPPLARNLRRLLAGEPAVPFTPQRNFLSLVSTGDRYAVAARGRWAIAGGWVWRWKDHIDRTWMRKYADLPAMDDAPDADSPPMRCAGCGGKLGGDLLHRALSKLKPVARPDVLIGLDAPDDAAVAEVPAGKVTVHSVDMFRDFLGDPFRFGRIAANHALADIYAMGAAPQTALAIVTLPFANEAKMADDLYHLLAGAQEAFVDSHTALVGGHTMEGSELALGFAVNGLADRDALTRKGGLRPGDRLILTRPIGTGALFAADMRGRAKGRWISAAVAGMCTGHRAAAEAIRPFRPSACTDVSGFGLAGHLLEMLKGTGHGARLSLGAVPLLDGAAECAAAGLLSTLHPANLRFAAALGGDGVAADDPRHTLLFDPQTAGGLLMAVAPDVAEACTGALRSAGYPDAAIIGTVTGPATGGPLLQVDAPATRTDGDRPGMAPAS